MNPLLIYLHGFLSSPQADKARATATFIADRGAAVDFLAPEIPPVPAQALDRLRRLVAGELDQGREQVALIGSSLGGFYATVLSEQFDLRAVLINPAVAPHRLLAQRLGRHRNPYSGVEFELGPEDLDVLAAAAPAQPSRPGELLVLLQAGDEVLDYRQALRYYAASPQLVERGGNHRFEGFARHLPAVFNFLGLAH